MKIAFVVFNGITWLDFMGIYDPVTRLKSLKYIPDLSWDICSYSGSATDNFGLEIKGNKVRPSLQNYDVVIIPGGFGTRRLQYDHDFINWIKTSYEVPLKVSICTGSLILGAAGFLKGKKATTNFQVYEALKPYCDEVTAERVVEDDHVITSGAVSSSIDVGLYLCNKWAGKEAEAEIKKKMGYDE